MTPRINSTMTTPANAFWKQGVCTLQVLVDHPRKCNLVDIDAAVAVGVEGLGGGQDEER